MSDIVEQLEEKAARAQTPKSRDFYRSIKAEIERLRAALEPFVRAAADFDCWDEAPADSFPLHIEHCSNEKAQFTIADLHRLRGNIYRTPRYSKTENGRE
jgi:hypothetical protein